MVWEISLWQNKTKQTTPSWIDNITYVGPKCEHNQFEFSTTKFTKNSISPTLQVWKYKFVINYVYV